MTEETQFRAAEKRRLAKQLEQTEQAIRNCLYQLKEAEEKVRESELTLAALRGSKNMLAWALEAYQEQPNAA